MVCTSPNFCNREFSLITGKTLENQNTFQFYFSGCGWKAKSISWDSGDILWIKLLDKLMFMMFGEDFFEYVFDEKRTCHVHDGFKPQFVYNRHEWNCEYENMISNSFGFTSKMQGKSDIIWWGRFIDWANNTQLYSIPICSLAYFALGWNVAFYVHHRWPESVPAAENAQQIFKGNSKSNRDCKGKTKILWTQIQYVCTADL